MPYPNFHSARVKEPSGFKDIVVLKTLSNGIMVYGGKLKGEEKTTEQSYRFPKDKFTVSESKAWLKEHDISFILFEPAKAKEEHSKKKYKTHELNDIDIVAAGKWKGHTYTEKDLDGMISAFNELQGKVNVPLVLGHSDEQKLLQKDGYPNAGLVTNMKRVGKKIVASFRGVPEKIKKLIDLGGYRSISPEIFPNYTEESTSKKYKNILWRIALLGKEHKAMTTLDDMLALYSNFNTGKEGTYKFTLDEPVILNSDEGKSKKEEVKKMELEKKVAELESKLQALESKLQAIEEEKEKLSKENEELSQKNEKLKETEKERDELKNSIEEFNQKELDTKINSFVDSAIKDGKMWPAQKDNVISVLKSGIKQTVKYTTEKDGEKMEKEGNLMDALKTIFYSIPGSIVKMSEEFEHATEESKTDKTLEKSTGVIVENVDLDNKIKKYAKENEVSYEDAFEIVVNE